MTPFLRFRLWARRAPVAERAVAAIASVVAVALLVWILQPTGGDGTTSASATGGATLTAGASAPTAGGPGQTATTTAPAISGVPGATAGGAGQPGALTPSGGAAAPAAGAPTACSGGVTDQGVSPTEVKVGIMVGDIQGQVGNSLIGLPPPDEEKAEFQAAIDYVNKHGGLACRKIVPSFYNVNLLDATQAHSQCLAVVQDKVFAVIDTALTYVAGEKDCVAKAKIPFLTIGLLFQSEVRDYYPYVFSWWGRWDTMMLDYALGSKAQGFFDPAKGFKKLGVTTESCYPELNDQLFAALDRAGVKRNTISVFDYGCPTGLVLPNQISQAVLQFQTDGVTNVMDAYSHSENDFSKQAQRQGYHPKYSLADGGEVTTFETASFAPDPDNYDGAIAVTMQQSAALHSGIPLSAGTKPCDDAAAAAGKPSAEKSSVSYMGAACNGVFWLTAMANKTVPLVRQNLVNGLAQVGDFPFSYPAGPATFKDAKTVVGGHFWRPLHFEKGCACFKVSDAAWKPNFS